MGPTTGGGRNDVFVGEFERSVDGNGRIARAIAVPSRLVASAAFGARDRAVAVDINVMDYVEAAKLRGEGSGWIIFREILPNALSPLVAEVYASVFGPGTLNISIKRNSFFN